MSEDVNADQTRGSTLGPTAAVGAGLDWNRDGADWPNRVASSFIDVGGIVWHVQRLGSGPIALLLHGTGAATHSWRDLAPLLGQRFTVIAPDLPGHGFTRNATTAHLSLPGMSAAVANLLRALNAKPDLIVGHSAGAAVAARMCLDGTVDPALVASINGALLPLQSFVFQFFSPLARMLSLNPLVPRMFAWTASDASRVERLLRDTGSVIDADGLKFYHSLFQSPGHAAGALGMMANWDLVPLARDLPKFKQNLTLIVGNGDKSVPPDDAWRVKSKVATATIEVLRELGHLAHEESPQLVADVILRDFTNASKQIQTRKLA
jgi:magnesium chelatase accessory protein